MSAQTDRELLELAAKAAGIPAQWDEEYEQMQLDYIVKGGTNYEEWNPLTDDGDALRLAASLNINISFRENINGAWVVAERSDIHFCPESLDGPHENDATRRAIVRAAAAIAEATGGAS